MIKKVIVIGLDGLEPRIVARSARSGPTSQPGAAAGAGRFRTVATTTPAQTPVAWSTFATGTNPGGHGIFDFLRRNPQTYLPDLALNRYEQKNVFLPPEGRQPAAGNAVWELLGAAGIGSTDPALSVYLPARLGSRADALGHGRTRPAGRPGNLHVLHHERRGPSPRKRKRRSPASRRRTADRDLPDRSAQPQDGRRPAGGDHRHESIPRDGECSSGRRDRPRSWKFRSTGWSDWLRVKFKLGLLQIDPGNGPVPPGQPRAGARAVCVSPINFDPEFPLFPISDARRLRGRPGLAKSGSITRPAWSKTTPG